MTVGTTGIVTRVAHADDLDAVKRIADGNKSALGFVHRGALVRAIPRQELIVAESNVGVVGFLHLYRRRDGVITVYHLAVAGPARGAGIGRAMVQRLRASAIRDGATALRLKCPTDLPANAFYHRIGFTKVATEDRSIRPLTVWWLDLEAESRTN